MTQPHSYSRFKVRASLLILLLTLSACSRLEAFAEPTEEPFKMGFITSLTGVAGVLGQDMEKGIRLFVNDYNKTTKGRKIELIVENDGSNPATSIAKVGKLVEKDKVQVITGVLMANVGYAVAPACERYKVPFVASICAGDDLTQRLHFDWLVRTSGTASQSKLPFGDWVYKKLKYKRIVSVAMDYEFGWESVGGFQKGFEGAGGQVVQKIWAPLGFTDFSGVIDSVDKSADAIFLLGVGKAADNMTKQFRQRLPNMPIIGAATSFDACIQRYAGDELLGAMSPINYTAQLNTPANKRFVAAYRAAYGETPSYYSEGAYTSGLWIARAVELLKGNTIDNKKLLAALKTVALKDAPRGPLRLDDRSNVVENVYVCKVEKVNGKLQNTVIYTFPNVSQFWKYAPREYLKQPSYGRTFPPCRFCPHEQVTPIKAMN